jgi:hypothetical protein
MEVNQQVKPIPGTFYRMAVSLRTLFLRFISLHGLLLLIDGLLPTEYIQQDCTIDTERNKRTVTDGYLLLAKQYSYRVSREDLTTYQQVAFVRRTVTPLLKRTKSISPTHYLRMQPGFPDPVSGLVPARIDASRVVPLNTFYSHGLWIPFAMLVVPIPLLMVPRRPHLWWWLAHLPLLAGFVWLVTQVNWWI